MIVLAIRKRTNRYNEYVQKNTQYMQDNIHIKEKCIFDFQNNNFSNKNTKKTFNDDLSISEVDRELIHYIGM
jgi:cell shape-determining protein MreC